MFFVYIYLGSAFPRFSRKKINLKNKKRTILVSRKKFSIQNPNKSIFLSPCKQSKWAKQTCIASKEVWISPHLFSPSQTHKKSKFPLWMGVSSKKYLCLSVVCSVCPSVCPSISCPQLLFDPLVWLEEKFSTKIRENE